MTDPLTRLLLIPREPPNIRTVIRMLAVELAEQAVDVIKEDLGRNNDSAAIREMRANDGTGLNADTKAPWCASFVSNRYVLALRRVRVEYGMPGLELGFKTSRGARRLVNRIAKAGVKITDWDQVQRGDVVLKDRDGGAHVMIAVDKMLPNGKLPIVEGNAGRNPAPVRLFERPVDSLLYAARY